MVVCSCYRNILSSMRNKEKFIVDLKTNMPHFSSILLYFSQRYYDPSKNTHNFTCFYWFSSSNAQTIDFGRDNFCFLMTPPVWPPNMQVFLSHFRSLVIVKCHFDIC